MTEKFAEVDITPKGVEDGRGQIGRRNTVFQDSEINQIKDNPGRLTKEGVEKKVELWKKSSNAHNVIKYKTMLAKCEKFEKSGKDIEGDTIFSYDKEGNPHWTSADGMLPKKQVAPTPSSTPASTSSTKSKGE